MIGPGKYDEETEVVMRSTRAACVALLVVAGERGHGFSVQSVSAEILKSLPSALRQLADEVEKDMGGGQG